MWCDCSPSRRGMSECRNRCLLAAPLAPPSALTTGHYINSLARCHTCIQRYTKVLEQLAQVEPLTHRPWLGRRIFDSGQMFLYLTVSRRTLGPTQSLQGTTSPGSKAARGMKLTTHLYLGSISRLMELHLHSPHSSSLHSA
jgi:hypothetical protein